MMASLEKGGQWQQVLSLFHGHTLDAQQKRSGCVRIGGNVHIGLGCFKGKETLVAEDQLT